MLKDNRRAIWRRINLSFWLLLRDLRFYYLTTFKPEYVHRQMSLRKGECPPDCGACCKGCKHLKKDNKCALYGNPLRPTSCAISPVDVFDKVLLERAFEIKCYLYWDT